MTAFQAERRHGGMILIDHFAAPPARPVHAFGLAGVTRLNRAARILNQTLKSSGFIP